MLLFIFIVLYYIIILFVLLYLFIYNGNRPIYIISYDDEMMMMISSPSLLLFQQDPRSFASLDLRVRLQFPRQHQQQIIVSQLQYCIINALPPD